MTPCKNPAAVALGKLGGLVGGKSTSAAKRRASAKNGKLGGRPKGSKNNTRIVRQAENEGL